MQTLATAVPEAIGHGPTSGVSAWIWILLLVAGVVATVTDLRAMRIPNWLTLPLLAAGICFSLISSGTTGFYESLAGAAAAGALFVAAYATLGGGAGDAKLMLAFGSWLGFEASIALLVCVTVAGFVIALSVIVRRSGIRDIPVVIFVSVVRTLGGLVVLRKALLVGTASSGPTPATSAGSVSGGSASGGSASCGSGMDAPDRDPTPLASKRPKGWLPYAPAILLGTASAWIFLDIFGGFARL